MGMAINMYRSITTFLAKISGSHGGEYEDKHLLGVVPSSLVEVWRRFSDACYLYHQGDDDDDDQRPVYGDSTHL
jgi:hypothetical protein